MQFPQTAEKNLPENRKIVGQIPKRNWKLNYFPKKVV